MCVSWPLLPVSTSLYTVMSFTMEVLTHAQTECPTLGRHRGICLTSKLHSLSNLCPSFSSFGSRLLFSPIPSSRCCLSFLFFCFGSNPCFWQGFTGSLVWGCVTGLAMRQSPVEHAHIHTCRCAHSEWGPALTTPKWAISQTAIIRTAMLLLSILYFAPPPPNPSVYVY